MTNKQTYRMDFIHDLRNLFSAAHFADFFFFITQSTSYHKIYITTSRYSTISLPRTRHDTPTNLFPTHNKNYHFFSRPSRLFQFLRSETVRFSAVQWPLDVRVLRSHTERSTLAAEQVRIEREPRPTPSRFLPGCTTVRRTGASRRIMWTLF